MNNDNGDHEPGSQSSPVQFTLKNDKKISNNDYQHELKVTQNETKMETQIYDDLINDTIFGLVLQVHRAAKLGYLMYTEPNVEFEKQFKIYDDNDVLGIFNNNSNQNESSSSSSSLNNNNSNSTSRANASNNRNNSQNINLSKYECICPSCKRNLVAIRFAPHLEKCMGMGRNR
jgi:hypothetical protein